MARSKKGKGRVVAEESPCHLFRLPPELLLDIYNYVLPATRRTIIVSDAGYMIAEGFHPPACLWLLFTCHKIYDEALPVLHAKSTIHFGMNGKSHPATKWKWESRMPFLPPVANITLDIRGLRTHPATGLGRRIDCVLNDEACQRPERRIKHLTVSFLQCLDVGLIELESIKASLLASAWADTVTLSMRHRKPVPKWECEEPERWLRYDDLCWEEFSKTFEE